MQLDKNHENLWKSFPRDRFLIRPSLLYSTVICYDFICLDIPGSCSNDNVAHYANKCLEVASKNCLPCIDLYTDMMATPVSCTLLFPIYLHDPCSNRSYQKRVFLQCSILPYWRNKTPLISFEFLSSYHELLRKAVVNRHQKQLRYGKQTFASYYGCLKIYYFCSWAFFVRYFSENAKCISDTLILIEG